jgi:hypothetical protein
LALLLTPRAGTRCNPSDLTFAQLHTERHQLGSETNLYGLIIRNGREFTNNGEVSVPFFLREFSETVIY